MYRATILTLKGRGFRIQHGNNQKHWIFIALSNNEKKKIGASRNTGKNVPQFNGKIVIFSSNCHSDNFVCMDHFVSTNDLFLRVIENLFSFKNGL